METAKIPAVPADARFTCTEELMAQKAECQECDEAVRRNAKLWAERHVQQTGHNVHVSLYLDMRGEGWVERLAPERRAEIEDLVKNPGKARALAGKLLGDIKGQKVN